MNPCLYDPCCDKKPASDFCTPLGTLLWALLKQPTHIRCLCISTVLVSNLQNRILPLTIFIILSTHSLGQFSTSGHNSARQHTHLGFGKQLLWELHTKATFERHLKAHCNSQDNQLKLPANKCHNCLSPLNYRLIMEQGFNAEEGEMGKVQAWCLQRSEFYMANANTIHPFLLLTES